MRIERTGEIVLSLSDLPVAEARVEKLARRAKRLGLAEPKLVELGACAWRVTGEDGMKHVVRGMVLRVEGERPVLPGRKLLGTVEPVKLAEGGTEYLVFASPDAQERGIDLSRYAGKGCDHCKTNRNRKLLVLVEREEDGAVVRVGRECVQSYLPGVSVEALVEAAGYSRALDGIGDDEGGWDSYGGGDPGLFVHDYLALCFAAVRVDGSYKPAALEENSTRSVVDFMRATRRNSKASAKDREVAEKYRATEADKLLADAAIAWARTIEPKSDFERNVRIAAQAEVLNPRRAGLVAAIVPAFNRDLVKRAEAKVERVSEHVGTVGERRVFKGLLVKVAYEIEGDYGISTLYAFEDEAGRALKWKASGAAKLQKGWRYDLKGTVKEHGDYKGTKQTVLTRCAVEGEHEPAEVREAREMRERAEAEAAAKAQAEREAFASGDSAARWRMTFEQIAQIPAGERERVLAQVRPLAVTELGEARVAEIEKGAA